MQQLKALGGTRAPSQVSLDTDEIPDEVRRRIQADLRLYRAFDSTAVPAVWRDPRSGKEIVVAGAARVRAAAQMLVSRVDVTVYAAYGAEAGNR